MIMIDGITVKMEGDFGTLIKEISKVIHTIAKSAHEKFNDTEENVGYDDVMENILMAVANLKKFDKPGVVSGLPDEVEEDFFKQLRDERKKNSGLPNFIDYDTTRPNKEETSSYIKNIIGEAFQNEDPKRAKKNKKKK